MSEMFGELLAALRAAGRLRRLELRGDLQVHRQGHRHRPEGPEAHLRPGLPNLQAGPDNGTNFPV